MKKVFLLVLFFSLPLSAQAQSDCPIGMINDPAPGACSRYVDRDGNNLCDLSEFEVAGQADAGAQSIVLSEEELKQLTVREMAEAFGISTEDFKRELSGFTGISVNGGDSMQVLHDSNGLCMGVASAIANDIKANAAQSAEAYHDIVTGQELKLLKVAEAAELYQIDASQYAALLSKYLGAGVTPDSSFQDLHDNLGLEPSIAKDIAAGLQADTSASQAFADEGAKNTPRYLFLPILAVLVALYSVTSVLAKAGKIKLLTHRRIWNVLLLSFFLLSGISGILLVLKVNYGWAVNWPFNMLKFHVETGVAMSVITVFHIAWHWQYFTAMLRR